MTRDEKRLAAHQRRVDEINKRIQIKIDEEKLRHKYAMNAIEEHRNRQIAESERILNNARAPKPPRRR